MAKSEDLDEMLHNASCLLKTKKLFFFCEIITCNPQIYTMDHPELTSILPRNFIVGDKVNDSCGQSIVGPVAVLYNLNKGQMMKTLETQMSGTMSH